MPAFYSTGCTHLKPGSLLAQGVLPIGQASRTYKKRSQSLAKKKILMVLVHIPDGCFCYMNKINDILN